MTVKVRSDIGQDRLFVKKALLHTLSGVFYRLKALIKNLPFSKDKIFIKKQLPSGPLEGTCAVVSFFLDRNLHPEY